MNPPVTIHKKVLFFCAEGLPYISSLFLSCIILSIVILRWPGPLLIVIDFFLWLSFAQCCYFFRDPERNTPFDPELIISPADGKIINIRSIREETFLEQECRRVSIFMNVFDVHVNRSPVSGVIKYFHYNPGKFISAFKEKASLDNEQVAIGIEGGGEEKIRVFVKLIAGLIARRIVLWKKTGDHLGKGERMSLIKFGSRVDLYLPSQVEVKVKEGDRVKAGETVIGILT